MRDGHGFDEFYRATSLRMVRYAYALTGDLAEAQDVVQDAFTKAWRHWAKVAAPSEDTVLLTAALRKLPAHLRQALALPYLFDPSVAQIAEETGAPVGAVTSWLHRGRTELAAVLTAGHSLEVLDAE